MKIISIVIFTPIVVIMLLGFFAGILESLNIADAYTTLRLSPLLFLLILCTVIIVVAVKFLRKNNRS